MTWGVNPAAAATWPAQQAGRFYPADSTELTRTVDEFLAAARSVTPSSNIFALAVPHAGYAHSGKIAARAYATISGNTYRRVVILAPSHHGNFRGLALLKADALATPLGDVPVDTAAIDTFLLSGTGNNLFSLQPKLFEREHAVETQLPFLQRTLKGFQVLPILVGRLSYEDALAAAQALRGVIDKDTLVVVSGDWTHYGPAYGFTPFTGDVAAQMRQIDRNAISRLLAGQPREFIADRQRSGHNACAFSPALLLSVLTEAAVTNGFAAARLLAYETSAVPANDRNAVGYAALAWYKVDGLPGLSDAEKTWLTALARRVLTSSVSENKLPVVNEAKLAAHPVLAAPRGVFVSLYKGGTLRGCIGEIAARKPLYQSVIDNTLRAARQDGRFPPVRPDELGEIRIEISVLSPLVRIADLEDFDITRNGIVLRQNGRQGVFLPQVAAQNGWGKERLLDELAAKAGLPSGAWRGQGAEFRVFETLVFGEAERVAP